MPMLKGFTNWFIILFISVLGLQAQPQTVLNANNVSATVSANGTLFSGGLETPKNSGKNAISVAQFWIGGKNNGNVHVAAQLNDSLAAHDFWAGPLNTTSGTAADSNTWNVIAKVSKNDVEQHIANYKKDGYSMPAGIENWPGSSPTGQGFAQVLAPFVDFNSNKIYEPEKGEYPYIRGDEAAYFVVNDNANNHFVSGGLPLGVEVHGMVYQYANTPDVENTVFLQLSFINRSANNYDSVFAGIWADFALGDPTDNYISSAPNRSAFFAYNGDTLDGTVEGYGNNPPAQAVVFLSPKLQHTIEIASDNSVRGLPQTPLHFYNYLKRNWKDNSKLVEGFNGYSGGGGTPADFIYDGDPCNTGNPGWTEFGSALPWGKRTMLGSFGPVSLSAGAVLQMDVAFVWSRGNSGQLSSVCELQNDINRVTTFYNKNISGVKTPTKKIEAIIYPNPAANTATVRLNNGAENFALEVYNIQGKKLIELNSSASSAEINTKALASGIYSVRIYTDKGFAIKKLIVTH